MLGPLAGPEAPPQVRTVSERRDKPQPRAAQPGGQAAVPWRFTPHLDEPRHQLAGGRAAPDSNLVILPPPRDICGTPSSHLPADLGVNLSRFAAHTASSL